MRTPLSIFEKQLELIHPVLVYVVTELFEKLSLFQNYLFLDSLILEIPNIMISLLGCALLCAIDLLLPFFH